MEHKYICYDCEGDDSCVLTIAIQAPFPGKCPWGGQYAEWKEHDEEAT